MVNAAPSNFADAASVRPTVGIPLLIRSIRRHSVLVFLFVLAAVAAGAGVWLFLPLPKNTGYVVFQVSSAPPAVLHTTSDPRHDFNLYKQFQAATIRSKLVLNTALADPSLAGLPTTDPGRLDISALAANLKIDFTLGPEFMRVVLEGDNRDELVVVLKAVTAAYLKEVVNKDKSQRVARLEQLKALQNKYVDGVRANRNKIRGVMEALGSGDPLSLQIRERFLEAQIGSAQQQLNTVISAMRETSVENRVMQDQTATAGPRLIPDPVLEDLAKSDPTYSQLKKQQTDLTAAIDQLTGFAQPGVKTPKMLELERELSRVNGQLKELPGKLKPEIESRLRESAARTDAQRIELFKNKVGLLKEMQSVLGKDIDELIAKKRAIGVGQFELEELKQEVGQTERIADKIATEIETLKPELDAPNRVAVWEEPTAVAGIEGNRRTKYTAMASLGVFTLGIVLVTWLEYRNRRIQSPDEVVAGLGLRVVGTVPAVPKKLRSVAGRISPWEHMLTESVNTTRTMLLSSGVSKPCRSLLVSSAMSGEGKTSLSTHLAVSLARAGLRVLLIDADMRRPAVHRVFDLPRGPGLAEVLTGRADLAGTVTPCRIPSLHLLRAGSWSADAASGIAGIVWDSLLAQAMSSYDFVLIDSPPILPVADALSIARGVDGVILAVMKDVSRFKAVEVACQRLMMVGATVLGAVISGIEAPGYYYYYDRKYSTAPAEQVPSMPTPQEAT